MSPHLPRATSLKKIVSSAFFMLAIASILIGLTATGSFASKDDPILIPILEIRPTAQSFDVNTTPSFNITSPAGSDFVVQLTLAKKFFSGDPSLDSYIKMSGDAQNYYSYTGYTSTGSAIVNVPLEVWKNLRGSIVYYRLYSLAPDGGSTTPNSNWNNAPSVQRTGESWYGLPLNDKATIGGTPVILNGELNTTALSSDFGPRFTDGSKFHAGLDIPVANNTPVYAIADGTVRSSPENSSDHILMIEHDGGRKVGYVHLSAWLTEVNQTVVRGELIGYSGDWVSNQHKSPHLHIDSGYRNVDSTLKASGAIFFNPLHYLPYTDNYGEGIRFLRDTFTRSRPIDIEPAAGDQNKILVAFGLTTEYDKDLNYVKVQVNGSTAVGQYFVLNYDEVVSQDSTTGVVTLSNGRTFRIRPLDENIYADTDLRYDFYVQPGSTNVNVTATDYFFFPWDMTPFMNGEDDGPQNIIITAQEVTGSSYQWPKTIGPEIQPVGSEVNGRVLTATIDLTYHDVMSGSLRLEARGVPTGWTASFDRPVLNMAPEANATVILTLTSPDVISPDLMESNQTRIVVTFDRIAVLQDTEVLCPAGADMASVSAAAASESVATGVLCPAPPGKAEIVQPISGQVTQGENIQVKVNAMGAVPGASHKLIVENENTGNVVELGSVARQDNYLFFSWTPSEASTTYVLTAQVDGLKDSEPVRVWTPGSLRFIQPSGTTVDTSQSITIKVEAEGMDQVFLQITPDDGGSGGWMTHNGTGIWSWSTWKPQSEGQEYTLRVTGYPSNDSNTITIYHYVTALPPEPVIEVANSVTLNEATTVKVNAPGSNEVNLVASGPVELIKSGYNEATQQGDGVWQFEWTPDISGPQTITSHVYYAFQGPEMIIKDVDVIDEGQNVVIVEILSPKTGDTIVKNRSTDVHIQSPGDLTKVDLEITDPNGNVTHQVVNAEEVNGPFANIIIPWKPTAIGAHLIKAYGWNASGYKGWTDPGVILNVVEPSPVDPSEQGTWTWINEWSFLWKNTKSIEQLGEGGYFDPVYYNTLIPQDKYVCGIVGLSARGGDIGEDFNVDPIDAYLTTWQKDTTNSWQIMVNINTLNKGFWYWFYKYDFDDKPEHWDVQLMCFDRSVASEGGPQLDKPIFLKQLPWRESEVNVSTGYRVDQYACGIVGFNSTQGDIDEKGVGDIFRNDLYDNNGVWWLHADFRTHDGEHESWQHNILCVDRRWAALGKPETGKPFIFTSFSALGDDITTLTDFRTDEWVCGLSGFSALHGDIDEGEKDNNSSLLLAYMYEDTALGKWRIRADFRTHEDSETWNVDVMCVAKEGVSIQSVQSYLFTGKHPDGLHYGPGMKIDFTDGHDPGVTHYRVQYSTDGGAKWNNIYTGARPLSDGSWINHHGNKQCGRIPDDGSGVVKYLYGHCLDASQNYMYRVGLLANASDEEPIGGKWSEPVSATSYDWPAYFETEVILSSGDNLGGYLYYTVHLRYSHGPGLSIKWEFEPVLGATYVRGGNCISTSKTCNVKVYPPSGQTSSSLYTIAEHIPGPGINLVVTGTDTYVGDGGQTQHTWTEVVYLESEPGGGEGGDPMSTFADVPPDHWAVDYFESLYSQGYISGFEEDGQVYMKPEDTATRSQASVLLVRAWHQDPEYIPQEPTLESLYFEDVQLVSLVSTSSLGDPDTALPWSAKWNEENYKLGFTSGCSEDPPMFCGEGITTRAQAATFFVKVLHGPDFRPPEVYESSFSDVQVYHADGSLNWQPKWIEQATYDGLIQVCGTDMLNMNFRPEQAVTRAEMICMMFYTLQAKN